MSSSLMDSPAAPIGIESPENGHVDQADSEECCDSCDNSYFDLFFCNVCKCTLCSECWSMQVSHKKQRLAPGAIPHEKTDSWVAKQVQKVFSPPLDESTCQRMYLEDEDTAWFGIVRENRQEEPLLFQDRGRYAELMTTTNAQRMKIGNSASFNLGYSSFRDTRTPSLVSFVGQTGAGKSSLIKLIIDLSTRPGRGKSPETFPSPVVGISGHDRPTSEDVHLYLDPSTAVSEAPVLYADCEGLDGGEREPLGATYRRIRQSSTAQTQNSEESPFKARYSSERTLVWTNSPNRRTRHFAVSNLYPRLLFTFSDVIIFVLRNPRIIEGVFERLVEWAAAALETSSNQPVLPHAIIALNASENSVDPELWDVDVATERLLESLSHTVHQNVCFKKYAQLWEERNRQIETVEELMLLYYSSLRIVRIPAEGRPKLIQEQTEKMHKEIQRGCQESRDRKAALRMLLNAEELQSYLQCAFDHFAGTLDVAFDFVQASFFNNPIPLDFGGNILKLAINMMEQKEHTKARSIFDKLSCMVASCIMQDSVRHNIKGTAEHIFPQYLDHLDAALRDFCDRHWPCEYVMRGAVPTHLQSHLNTLHFHHNMRASALLYRCVNVRSGHGSKGHQLKDGRVFAVGGYISDFSFENYQKQFHNKVYFHLQSLLKQLADCTTKGEIQHIAAARIHRNDVLGDFYGNRTKEEARAFQSHSVCLCCLFEPPEHALPCGHVLCTPCVKSYGRVKSRNLIEMHECPLETNTPGRCQSLTLYLKPEDTGIRILTLDGGGTHGMIQLEILHLIEREMNGKLPIQCFFDMIVGKGTGGIIALGLTTQNWTLEDCFRHYERICNKGFSRHTGHSIPGLGWIRERYNKSKFETSQFEMALKDALSESQYLFGGPRPSDRSGSHVKVAVTATSSTGKTVLLANYNRRCSERLQYHFCRPEKSVTEMKVWEAARATMAIPKLFKPFHHEPSKQVYFDGAPSPHNPILIAHEEYKIASSEYGFTPDYPDIVVSIGTGLETESSRDSQDTDRMSIMSRVRGRASRGAEQRASRGQMASSAVGHNVWDDYLNLLQVSAPDSRFVRLDAAFSDDLPPADHISHMKSLQNLVRGKINADQIKQLAAQLFATLFYFESLGTSLETSDNQCLVQGKLLRLCFSKLVQLISFLNLGYILCRLPDETPEICEIGKLLRDGNVRNAHFAFQEDGCDPQHFEITTGVVEDMISSLHFRMAKIQIRLSKKRAAVEAALCLKGEECSISGFPRSLVRDNNQTRRRHQANQLTDHARSRRRWNPPDPHRLPPFLALPHADDPIPVKFPSESFRSSETSLSAPRRPSLSHRSPINDNPGMPPEIVRPPFELENLKNHEAERLQREREIIRNEEVLPLEQRLKRLEAKHSELETFIAQLQISSDGQEDNVPPGNRSPQSLSQNHPFTKAKSVDTDHQGLQSGQLRRLYLPESGFRSGNQMVATNPGPSTLDVALSNGDRDLVTLLVAQHFNHIAHDRFEWLLELREAGYGEEEIITRLLETEKQGPWVLGNLNIGTVQTGMQVPIHLPSCIHEGKSTTDALQHSKSPQQMKSHSSDPLADISRRNEMRKAVAACCKLAGAFPPDKSLRKGGGLVTFRGLAASITYGNLHHYDLIKHLREITKGLCNAAAILQSSGFSCDSFTILSVCSPQRGPSGTVPVIRLNRITFQHLQNFAIAVARLHDAMVDKYDVLTDGNSILLACESISMEILERLAVHGERDGVRERLHWPTTLRSLHICALAAQALCLGLVSYAYEHTGQFHPPFLRDSLTKVTLEGILDYQPHIIVELQELACMGDMIGDSVLVFRFRLDPTFQEQPNAAKRMSLWASGEDVVDTWGGNFVSDPKAPYGDRLYGIEIGGGMIKPYTTQGPAEQLEEQWYHWSPHVKPCDVRAKTFNCRQRILIGVPETSQSYCLEGAERCRNCMRTT